MVRLDLGVKSDARNVSMAIDTGDLGQLICSCTQSISLLVFYLPTHFLHSMFWVISPSITFGPMKKKFEVPFSIKRYHRNGVISGNEVLAVRIWLLESEMGKNVIYQIPIKLKQNLILNMVKIKKFNQPKLVDSILPIWVPPIVESTWRIGKKLLKYLFSLTIVSFLIPKTPLQKLCGCLPLFTTQDVVEDIGWRLSQSVLWNKFW